MAAGVLGPVWVHVVAAMMWIGGMLFLTFAVVPALRRAGFDGERRELFRAIAKRFRFLVWLAALLLLLTGPLLLLLRFGSLDPALWPSVLRLKLALVALLLALTAAHDVWIGPAAGRSGQPGSRSVRLTAWLGRLSLVVALLVVLCAVVLARG
jgi:uncharacterized membrane protein